ncbi:hypothetical protein [Anaerofustis sp.]|uniref:hypothetical protein n=1 Tax=Anaerofustis sp. TaxID=1872517 RepID=UPI0025BBE48A|nr:hypothetical protein [Anaerofustis sp.]
MKNKLKILALIIVLILFAFSIYHNYKEFKKDYFQTFEDEFPVSTDMDINNGNLDLELLVKNIEKQYKENVIIHKNESDMISIYFPNYNNSKSEINKLSINIYTKQIIDPNKIELEDGSTSVPEDKYFYSDQIKDLYLLEKEPFEYSIGGKELPASVTSFAETNTSFVFYNSNLIKEKRSVNADKDIYERKFYIANNSMLVTGVYYTSDSNRDFFNELKSISKIINKSMT